MAEDRQVQANAAPGETVALPTAADMDRNTEEERREIGRRARRMVDRCIAGAPVNPAALHEFGPAGRAYFFRELQARIASQLKQAAATRRAPETQSRLPPTTAESLLDISDSWVPQQVERGSYAYRAWRTGSTCALVLTSLAIAISFIFLGHASVPVILQTLEGLIHGLS